VSIAVATISTRWLAGSAVRDRRRPVRHNDDGRVGDRRDRSGGSRTV